MNRENLIGLALESGLSHKFANTFADTAEHIYTKGMEAGAAAERKECIKLCKWLVDRYPESDASSCVDIISLRGKE